MQEDDNWHIEQLHHQSICQHCHQERPIRSKPKRYRYHHHFLKTDTPPEPLQLLNAERWKTLHDLVNVIQKNRILTLNLVEEWLANGWVQIEEKHDPIRDKWNIEKVRLSPHFVQHWITRKQRHRVQQQQAIQADLLRLLDGYQTDWEQALVAQATHTENLNLSNTIYGLLEEQVKELALGNWHPLPDTNQQLGGSVHQRWIAIFRGLLHLLAYPRWEYERTFSAQWLGDSKTFATDRAQIAQYLSLTNGFESLGLIRHTPVVYAWGRWRGILNNTTINGSAGIPFVALSAETVTTLKAIQINANQILIVENQTVFETILRSPHRRDDTLYLFSGGFAGFAERHLLSAWFQAKPNLSWLVWTDWDIGGIRIQEHWQNWAYEQGLIAPQAFYWNANQLSKWVSYGNPIEPSQIKVLNDMHHPLAEVLLKIGVMIEQEAVLPDFSISWLD